MLNQNPSQASVTAAIQKRSRAILIALLFPTMAVILNNAMFGVALPTIRDEFAMSADVAAWLTIAFSLPFVMLMPLYGRLGDELGRSRLLITGILVFCVGTMLSLIAGNLALIFLGRIIQGVGAAGVTPLSLAIIAQRFLPEERGRVLGIWNSIAPATSIFAPSMGGFLVDTVGWRTIFIPAVAVGLLALLIVRWQVPSLRGKPNWTFLRTFDWSGVLLFGGAIVSLVLYVSSRPVTGVEPLRDWRLFSGVVLFGTGLFVWERRHPVPLIHLHILKRRAFRTASLSAGFRMGMMIGISFLTPLYLADVYDLNASTIGLLATAHSVALFVFIRIGGSLADRWPNRWLVTISLSLQLSVMAYFALLPGNLPLLWIIAGAVTHGLGAGLSLAALHRTALSGVASEQTGAAAGVYSMIRFAGLMLATAVAGVILQDGLDRGLPTLDAYQRVYGFLALVGLVGVFVASRLSDE